MLHINTRGISVSLKIWCLSDWINPDWINSLFFLVSPSTLIQTGSYSLLVCVCLWGDDVCIRVCFWFFFSFLSYNWSWHRQRPSDLINFKHNSSFDSSIKPISDAGSFKLSKALMPASYHSYAVKPSFPVSITSLYNNIIELLLSVLLYINV